MVEKAKNEANINHLQQELAAHKSHMHVMASRLDQVQLDVETKCEVLRNFFRLCSSVYKYWFEHIVHVDGFDTLYVADVFEIQDLKDCLAIEQEEKNELSTKLHELEKESECEIAFSFPCVQILVLVLACQNFIGNDFLCTQCWLADQSLLNSNEIQVQIGRLKHLRASL